MIDFTYRYNPTHPKPFFAPKDSQEALLFLRVGNEMIVRFYGACKQDRYPDGERPSVIELSAPEAKGEPIGDDGLPKQMPFALMIGCADARVPTELLFGQEFNDIFNIRVAGNILAEEGIGSLQFALRSFVPPVDEPGHRSLKLAAALGHRGCGAVRATLRAFLDPLQYAVAFGEPIGSILRRITSPPLVVACEAFKAVFGEDATSDPSQFVNLVELCVYLNAAWVAHDIQEWVNREGPAVADHVGVFYGVFDPNDWHVRALPPLKGEGEPRMFGVPPADLDALRELALEIARRLKAADTR